MPAPIEGIFLPDLDPEEAKIIWDAVKEAGYEQNGAGAKELFLDLILGRDEEKPFVSETIEFMKKNPEKVMAALASGKSLLEVAAGLLKKKG